MQQIVDAVTRLGFSYVQPDPAKFERFFAGASVWEGSGRNAGTARVEGENFLVNVDSVDFRTKNQRADRAEIETFYQKAPVSIEAEFRPLTSAGPTYVARLVVSLPFEGIDVAVENFDYQKSASVSAGDLAKLPEGTEFQVRLTQPLSSKKNKTGQAFEAVVDKDIAIDGRKLVSSGSRVTGQLVEVKGSGRIRGRAKMALKLTALSVGSKSQPIETNSLTKEAEGSGRRDFRRIAGGAVVGTFVGAIADGGSGAAKGAVIGGGVGVGATLITIVGVRPQTCPSPQTCPVPKLPFVRLQTYQTSPPRKAVPRLI